MRVHLLCCLIVFCFSCDSFSAETSDSLNSWSKNIDKVIHSYHKYGVFNGSVLIAKGDKVIYQQGVGFANKAQEITHSPETPFRIGSLSKTFTALLIMQLMEENKLDLNDSLQDVLPEYNMQQDHDISIRNLLDHTSGLPGHFKLPGWQDGQYQNNLTRQKWLQVISQLTVLSAPGKQYQYSNLNYFLLGCVIEKLTNKTYEKNLEQRILLPAKMHSTNVETSGKNSLLKTQGYQISDAKGWQVQSALNMQVFFAGANIYSTVVDLFNFEQALFSGKLLKAHTLAFWLNQQQAFAWNMKLLDIGDDKPTNWLSYSGQLQGFSSMLSIFGNSQITAKQHKNRFTIITLSNSSISYSHKQQLSRDLYGALMGTPKTNDADKFSIPVSFLLNKAALTGALAQQAKQLLTETSEWVVQQQDIDSLAQQFYWDGARHQAIILWELNTQLFAHSENARVRLEDMCRDAKITSESASLCTKAINTHSKRKISKGTLISNITVISPELREPLENHDVYIVADQIVSIGNKLQVNANKVIDGTGLFLTPGLIDAHTHLSGVPGMSFKDTNKHPNIVAQATRQIPKSYLYHGFTSVIDLHSDPRSIANWNKKAIRPQAYFCGAAPVMDGYPMSFLPKPLRYQITPYFLLDGDDVPQGIDPLQHTPKVVVKKILAAGASCVKTHYESGFGGKGNLPTPSLQLIRDLKNAARAVNLPLVLHANSQEAQRFGINAGVDVFAHGMWTWNDPTKTVIHGDIRNILDSAIAKNIALQPTIQVLYGERDLFDPAYLDREDLRKVLPQTLIDWYKTREGQGFRNRLAEVDYVKHILRASKWENIAKAPIKRAMSTLSYMAKNGAKLSFGSDTPSDLTYANPPGLNARFEMKRWQQAGVTPKQFLEAATSTNAKLFNLDSSIGSVQVSKRADLLILENNPLLNIDAYDSIKTVISAGKVLPRESLAAKQ